MENEGRDAAPPDGARRCPPGGTQALSRTAGSTSWSWIGPNGITVEIACL
jgi:hypothetical protein